jgi:hypothetical protein
MAKRGLREMKIAQKHKTTKKHREMGRDEVKELEGKEEASEIDNKKGICFNSRSAGHNERTTVKTGNEFLCFILEVNESQNCVQHSKTDTCVPH